MKGLVRFTGIFKFILGCLWVIIMVYEDCRKGKGQGRASIIDLILWLRELLC